MSTGNSEWWRDRSDGLLVVRRWNMDTDEAISEGIRARAGITGTNAKLVERHYRGIDGEVWPQLNETDYIQLVEGMASLDQLDKVRRYYDGLPSGPTYDLIYCQFSTPPEQGQQSRYFTFCGFEYGYLLSEWNHYSVLYNEVIWGLYSEMHKFSSLLNQDLLLPSYESVNELEGIRNNLIVAGSDLELDEICKPISIYAVPGTRNQN
jgi:hypothetical protein